MATTSTTTTSSTAEKMASCSIPTDSSLTSSIQTSSISSTVQPSSTSFTIPFDTQTIETNPETTTGTYLFNSTTPEDQTSTITMAAGSNPTDPSLTISIMTSATVQPTSTGFTMHFEPPPIPSPTAVEPSKNSSTSLSTSIAAEESATSETISVASASADSSSRNTIDAVIISATIKPTCARSLDPSPPPPSPLTPSKTKLVEPTNTPSKFSPLSIIANEPTGRDTVTSRTVNINRSTQATASYEASRTESSLMDSLISRPRDWGFNVFLDALATEITNEELKRLKLYFIGENGIGYGTLEKIETALEFFTILRRRNILTRDNMIYLQAMLWHLKRQDLHKKCVEHARNFGNVTYFYAPSPEPENGYRYVRFHVESNESINFDRRKLEYIRTSVAELLLVPPEFVLVSGLEPSSSVIITFMMPDYYASLLIEMVVDYCTPQLLDVGIDKIYYDGKLYPLLGKASNDNILGNVRGKLEDREELLERLKRAETWLEQREKDVIELNRLLDKAEKGTQKVSEGHAENKYIEIPTFRTQNDFASQKSSMEKSWESEPCTDVSVRTRSLIRSKARDECTHDIRKLENKCEELQVGLTRTKVRNLISRSTPGEQVKIEIFLPKHCSQIMQLATFLCFFIYYLMWFSAYLAQK